MKIDKDLNWNKFFFRLTVAVSVISAVIGYIIVYNGDFEGWVGGIFGWGFIVTKAVAEALKLIIGPIVVWGLYFTVYGLYFTVRWIYNGLRRE